MPFTFAAECRSMPSNWLDRAEAIVELSDPESEPGATPHEVGEEKID